MLVTVSSGSSTASGSEQQQGPLAGSALLAGFSQAELGVLSPLLEPLRFAAGEMVVAQGALDRSMYLCRSGRALISRGGVEVQRIGPGDQFGELALVAGTPRAASVVAQSELELARLSHETYLELHARHPALGRRLLEAITASVAGRLTDMTDGMRTLLRERSLPRRAVIAVRACGQERSVHPGTPIRQLLPTEVDGYPVIAGLIDRRAVSLASVVVSPCALEPLTAAHWEGQRIYRQSLGLLLLEAAYRIDPRAGLELQHSVGFGQRVSLRVATPGALERFLAELEPEMRRLVASAAPLREELWTPDEAAELFRERELLHVAELVATWRDSAVPLFSYGEVYALGLGPLCSDTGMLHDFGIDRDEDGLLLLYGERRSSSRPPRASSLPEPSAASSARFAAEAREVSEQTRAMTLGQDRFLRSLAITSVGAFNRVCIDGKVSELVRVHEGFHEKLIGQIADAITARRSEVKLVCVAGPSSSGKTTFIKRLRVQLQVNGLHPRGLSLDDYYCDRERTPRDAQGQYDFEALEALDLPLLLRDLRELLAGRRVQTARYDFRSGKSQPGGGPEIELGAQDVLVLEGIHGINPAILADTPRQRAFRVFICPLAQLPFDHLSRIHASDLRLLRRIVRDRHHRATTAEQNILRWPSVRRGERRNIFPHQRQADAVFDSSLVYEPAVLKVYAERYLLEVPHDSPAYTTAHRLLRLLDRFVTIYPDQVPPTSILREFIGGSGFEY
jgi:uridine kinase